MLARLLACVAHVGLDGDERLDDHIRHLLGHLLPPCLAVLPLRVEPRLQVRQHPLDVLRPRRTLGALLLGHVGGRSLLLLQRRRLRDGVVREVRVRVGRLAVGSRVLLCRKANETLVEDVDLQRVEAGDGHVDAQVELALLHQEGVGDVPLHDARLHLVLRDLLDQADALAAARRTRLDDVCEPRVRRHVGREQLCVLRQHPRQRRNVVLLAPLLVEAAHVLVQQVLATDAPRAGEVVDALVVIHRPPHRVVHPLRPQQVPVVAGRVAHAGVVEGVQHNLEGHGAGAYPVQQRTPPVVLLHTHLTRRQHARGVRDLVDLLGGRPHLLRPRRLVVHVRQHRPVPRALRVGTLHQVADAVPCQRRPLIRHRHVRRARRRLAPVLLHRRPRRRRARRLRGPLAAGRGGGRRVAVGAERRKPCAAAGGGGGGCCCCCCCGGGG
eukprot:Rhum_TRINITY_DN14542_c4_g1::Rhum_TRINITY_DN14542_c4_g1_i1::g.97534::m.97534